MNAKDGVNSPVEAEQIIRLMEDMRNDEQREVLMRFFKTAPGQYGYGDEFLGLKVPQTRAIVKEAKGLVTLAEIEKLLYSQWHEVRLCGFLLLVEEMKRALPKKREPITTGSIKRKKLADFYLRHARQANNWDLVDLTCGPILGQYIFHASEDDRTRPYDILYKLSDSENLWEQRIAIVTNWELIRERIYHPTLKLAEKYLNHNHDLIHKATGWMLREVGKRDLNVLIDFLEKNYSNMPRTALRYAIEKLSPDERKYWITR